MKISILGDSHSRVFSNTNIFTTFFLGPGSDFNLVQKHNDIDNKLSYILPLIKDDFDYHMLLFGEPSCRYQVNKDHHIHKKPFNILDLVDESILNSITEKYKEIISNASNLLADKLIICAPISVYEPSIKFSKIFAENIGEYCKSNGISFVNIMEDITDGNFVKEEYKSDPIHASGEVLEYVEKRLSENGIDINIELSHTQENFDQIRKKFDFDDRFKCFIVKK